MAGQIDLMIDQASNVVPQSRPARSRPSPCCRPTRLPSTPDVPTVDEAGLPGLHISVWHGLWAPRAVPADVIAKVNAAVVARWPIRRRARSSPASARKCRRADQQTPQALGAFQKAEIEKWWPIVKAAGIKGE